VTFKEQDFELPSIDSTMTVTVPRIEPTCEPQSLAHASSLELDNSSDVVNELMERLSIIENLGSQRMEEEEQIRRMQESSLKAGVAVGAACARHSLNIYTPGQCVGGASRRRRTWYT